MYVRMYQTKVHHRIAAAKVLCQRAGKSLLKKAFLNALICNKSWISTSTTSLGTERTIA